MVASQKLRVTSDETKAKLRAANLGKRRGPHKPESIAKMRENRRGIPMSEETKAKIAIIRTGSKASPETRAKMSVSQAKQHAARRQPDKEQ